MSSKPAASCSKKTAVPTKGISNIPLVSRLAVTVAWPHLPPDLQRSPTYVWEFFAREHGTVNTPVVHEMFGLAMGPPDADTRARRLRVADGWSLSVFAEGHKESWRQHRAGSWQRVEQRIVG